MKHLSEHDRELPGYTGDLLEPSRLEVKEQVRHRGRSGRQTRRLRPHRVVVHCLVGKDHLVASYIWFQRDIPLQGMSQVEEMEGSAPLEYSVPQ